MRLLALTYGTEGDTRPIAAVCRAWMDAGHDVLLLGDKNSLACPESLGVPNAALSGDMQASLANLLSEGKGVNASLAALADIANEQCDSWMRQTFAAAQSCDGILVSGLVAFVGLSVAERLGKPLVGAGMIPISPTSAFPSQFIPTGKLPSQLNKASHHLVNWMLWLSFRRSVNHARAHILGLGPRYKLWTKHPMLYGVSPALLPAPTDWPANAMLCGQWLEPAPRWTPPADLVKFLDAGEPPIYLGFGSMTGFDREALLHMLFDALRGERILFYPGWSGMPDIQMPDNCLVVESTPHQWLFPRVSLAIHHGGSGTTHSACRAGIPSVVLPFAGDQFFWARQLARLGVADPTFLSRPLGTDAIRQAVQFAKNSRARAKAQALSEAMSLEDGTAVAVRAITSVLGTANASLN